MNKKSSWFDDVLFPSLIKQYEEKRKRGKEFYLSEKQERYFCMYGKNSDNPRFSVEYKGYGIYYTGYSSKNPLSWRNGKAWFEKI